MAVRNPRIMTPPPFSASTSADLEPVAAVRTVEAVIGDGLFAFEAAPRLRLGVGAKIVAEVAVGHRFAEAYVAMIRFRPDWLASAHGDNAVKVAARLDLEKRARLASP